jgi:hypothetical protein
MKTIGRLLKFLVLLGNLALLAALSLHVVRGPGAFAVTPKGQLTLLDTYVDTRNWSAADVHDHAAVVTRIVQSGHSALIAHVTNQTTAAVMQPPDADITDALRVPSQLLRAPATTQPAQP